jgi:hypothetical protein
VLAHLQRLSWRMTVRSGVVWGLAPYAEPVARADGTLDFRPRRAAESGDEGVSCVDDCARAALLALGLAEGTGALPSFTHGALSPRGRGGEAFRWALRWLSFVRYMQLPDGRFANFVLDATGRRNLSGPTSVPGGLWWTGRALWALARYHRLTGSGWALRAWQRCPLPELGDAGKTLGLFALAGLELLAADASALPPQRQAVLRAEQARMRPLVERWSAAIIASGPGYFRDYPGKAELPLWGYHQLHAVARAATLLDRPDFLPPCVATVDTLVGPAIAARGWYAYDPIRGGTREGLCAYCLAPLVQGLGALYDATGEERFRQLALQGADWLHGRNTAGVALYDPATGRCADGLDGPDADRPSPNCGAESSIEAGYMELERRRLVANTESSPRPAHQ